MSNKIKQVLTKAKELFNQDDATDKITFESIMELVHFPVKSGIVESASITVSEFLTAIGYYPEFEKDYHNSGVPQTILDAFNHVKSYFSSVTMFVINREGNWIFMDADFYAPAFNENQDTTILDKAVDAAYETFGLPYVYQEPLTQQDEQK